MLASKADKVFVFMDSCFTGQADGNSIFEGVAASRLRPKAISTSFGIKMAVLVAGTNKQFSTAYKDKGHRMFSYHMIKVLLERKSHTVGVLTDKVWVQVTDKTLGEGKFEQTPAMQGARSLKL